MYTDRRVVTRMYVHKHAFIVDLCMYAYTNTLVCVYTYFEQCHSISVSVCLSHPDKLFKMNISFHLRYQYDTDEWK
jgi:hypothetical protein